MVIKRSPGGEFAGGGRSTWKSTCEVPGWLHLAIDQHPVCPNLAPAWTLTSEFHRINWPLTSEMFTFGICTRVLQWSCLKAVSVSTFVLGGLRGFTATSDLVQWKRYAQGTSSWRTVVSFSALRRRRWVCRIFFRCCANVDKQCWFVDVRVWPTNVQSCKIAPQKATTGGTDSAAAKLEGGGEEGDEHLLDPHSLNVPDIPETELRKHKQNNQHTSTTSPLFGH